MEWRPEPELLASLDSAVPEILASQKANGQFGTEPWICTDQNMLLPLAAAWSLEESKHHLSEAVLAAIVLGGNALIDAQDNKGMWTFRKKDHSTWGQIYMPWAYSRWIRAYAIVREAMRKDDQSRWEASLAQGYAGIAAGELTRIHNIPTHHAMGLYCAGIVFDRDDWKSHARDFMQTVVAAQSEYGWWAEHDGPVVIYNFVYVESLGVYYKMSGDDSVLKALQRAAVYHSNYVYPDGSIVETVDGRNPYRKMVQLGNAGLSHTAPGRGFLEQQHSLYLNSGQKFETDYAANMLLYGGQGRLELTAQVENTYRMGDLAWIERSKPWIMSLSTFVGEPPTNRFGQDRQNFFSVYHDRTGLIVGGGNTKLQPLWSTFTVGDLGLMVHSPGDEDPDFTSREGLFHVAKEVKLTGDENSPGLEFLYGVENCKVTLKPLGDSEMGMVFETSAKSGMPVEAHVTLIPDPGGLVHLSTGDAIPLGEAPFSWSVPGDAGSLEHNGWRLLMPRGARVIWPALPHNPYRKDGAAEIEEARLVVALPFSQAVLKYELVLVVL